METTQVRSDARTWRIAEHAASVPVPLSGGALQGKRALVTGASRGIGKEIAFALASAGADVAINYRARAGEADEVARAIEALGRDTWVCSADVSRRDEVLRMRDSVERHFGALDILVNNAGINVDRLFEKMEPRDWEDVLSVDLTGMFHCIHAFLGTLQRSPRGRIINVTSIVGQTGNIGQVNYAAAKSGIIGLTKALARELALNGITVNAVAPGFIETEMLAGVPDKVRERILAQIPMRRFGRPADVAQAIAFLASDQASYITGHVLSVNGGMYL